LAHLTESFSARPARGRRRFAFGGIEEDIMEKLLYTPVEAARVLGVGRSKLYELLGTGELTSVRIGACRRISATALLEFVHRLSEPAQENHPTGVRRASLSVIRP